MTASPNKIDEQDGLQDPFLAALRWFDQNIVRRHILPILTGLMAATMGLSWHGAATDLASSTGGSWPFLFVLAVVVILASAPRPGTMIPPDTLRACLWTALIALFLIVAGAAVAMYARHELIREGAEQKAIFFLFAFAMAIVAIVLTRNISLGGWCNKWLPWLTEVLKALWPASFGAILLYGSLSLLYTAFASTNPTDMPDPIADIGPKFSSLLVVVFAIAAFAALIAIVFAVVDEAASHLLVVSLALLTIFAITFNLGSGVEWYLKEIVEPVLRLTASGSESWIVPETRPAKEVTDTIGILVALLSTGTVTVTASDALISAIKELQESLTLDGSQVKAATRLRYRAIDAVRADKHLAVMFENEIRIDQLSDERRFPLDTQGGDRKTRVKLIVRPGHDAQRSKKFDPDWIETLVRSQRGPIQRAMFLVCTAAPHQEILCYCTGEEFIELSRTTTPASGGYGRLCDAFYGALNAGNSVEISRLADEARHQILDREPARDVLLSSVTENADHELRQVMKTMARHRLSRILLVGADGMDQALLGADDLSSFLSR